MPDDDPFGDDFDFDDKPTKSTPTHKPLNPIQKKESIPTETDDPFADSIDDQPNHKANTNSNIHKSNNADQLKSNINNLKNDLSDSEEELPKIRGGLNP